MKIKVWIDGVKSANNVINCYLISLGFIYRLYIRYRMEKNSNIESILEKTIENYTIKHILFSTSQYIYLVVQYKKNSMRFTAAIAKKSQQSCQYIKMFRYKLKSKMSQELIFPFKELNSHLNGLKITLSIFKNEFIPLKQVLKTFQNANEQRFIVLFRDLLYTLYILHSNDIFHGRISPGTVYVERQKFKQQCSFALNILDTAYFFDKHYPEKTEQLLFCSQAQSFDLNLCQKDDLQSLVYLIVHLCSGSTLFTIDNLIEQIKKNSNKIPKWKSSFFFGEMQCILPPKLFFIREFYLQIKNTNRSEKPNYVKWLKRAEIQKNNAENHNLKVKQSKKQEQQVEHIVSTSRRAARFRKLTKEIRNQQERIKQQLMTQKENSNSKFSFFQELQNSSNQKKQQQNNGDNQSSIQKYPNKCQQNIKQNQ